MRAATVMIVGGAIPGSAAGGGSARPPASYEGGRISPTSRNAANDNITSLLLDALIRGCHDLLHPIDCRFKGWRCNRQLVLSDFDLTYLLGSRPRLVPRSFDTDRKLRSLD